MVGVRCDDEGGVGHPRGVPPSDNGEASKTAVIQVMGYTGGRGSTTGGRDEVIGQVNRPLAGNSGAVGGHTPNSGGMRAGDQIRGGGGRKRQPW